MNEFELIARLTGGLAVPAGVVSGVGDDCAVLDLGVPGQYFLLKTDAVVEGVHFTSATPPEKVGRKALARCLSDIAAMAGIPMHALITLGLPNPHEVSRIEILYQGLRACAEKYGVAIVGGETTTSTSGIWISVSLLGRVESQRVVFRRGAKVGDALFVTGELGGSLAGKHLDFEPRLAEARWLAAHFPVRAMIDLSDGLAGDLRHLLHAAHCGAELLAEAIPISRAARLRHRENPQAKPPLEAALTDGEDFELLFAVPPEKAVPLVDAWKTAFPGLKLTCVGKITAEPGIRIRRRKSLQPLDLHGYEHFA
ncbi:thiamine-phosphate kinase [Fontisphaera persica]|uniref:thiamine-phosphate kinase n=1 Tax=Fontisphaera persica TaxID=2974023 RepID=UPI0024C01295|nr:thiamine-phosphate kinase [Fontisphaera persica]WCJ60017.1 thiamine-phosphate kinase [Fontisphaera persica]